MNPYQIANITEAAALACFPWIGRGEKNLSDKAAVDAMRQAFSTFPAAATIVIGEGEKDEAPQLYQGELLGDQTSKERFDIAVDPLEGTTYLANGLPNALAVIGLAEEGAMFQPGPSFYMDKLVVPPQARGQVSPDQSVSERIAAVAKALDKDVSQVTVYILDRSRHKQLIADVYAAGARVLLYPAGDVIGSILAVCDDPRVDMLMGTGGTPEAILSACAIKAMGGDFFARINPQLAEEQANVALAGMDTTSWLQLEQLVAGEHCHFCATGVTADGLWLSGVREEEGLRKVSSCIITTQSATPVFVQHTYGME